jgi:hypothetical protein
LESVQAIIFNPPQAGLDDALSHSPDSKKPNAASAALSPSLSPFGNGGYSSYTPRPKLAQMHDCARSIAGQLRTTDFLRLGLTVKDALIVSGGGNRVVNTKKRWLNVPG